MKHNEQGKISTLLQIYNENASGGDVNSILAEYLLHHAGSIRNLTAGKLAAECHVDRSSVHRFCRLCGYGSFTGLKQAFAEYPETYAVPSKAVLHAYSDHFFTDMRNLCDELSELFPAERIDQFARAIHDAKRVTLICHDSSIYTCMQFQLFMVSAGKLVRLLHRQAADEEVLFKDYEPGDLILTLSSTGYFAREGYRLCASSSAQKVLITTDHSDAARVGYDRTVYLSKESHTEGKTVYSTYAAVILLDLLFQSYVRLYAAV